MSNNKTAWALLAAVCIAFSWGLVRLYELRLASGDVYPPYSSFRADPLGAKALYESVSGLPGYSVQRNARPLEDWHPGAAVSIFWLGEDPFNFALRPEDDFKAFEDVASRGARIVIAMMPVKRVALNAPMTIKGNALEKRWGIQFDYVRRKPTEREENGGALPKRTALLMKTGGQILPVIEKPFGKGSVVLVANAYPFSNEALAAERDTALLARMLGPNRAVVFDENHLGLSQVASIAQLAERYRLWGLGLGLAILAALFIWRASSPLLPPRLAIGGVELRVAEGRDSAAALKSLLRRNIPESELLGTCLAEWERSGHGGRYYGPEKLAIVRDLGAAAARRTALEAYRTLHSVITHRD